MTKYRFALLAAAAMMALTACGGEGDTSASADDTSAPAATPAVSQQSAEVIAPITEYRLTKDKVDRFFAVQENVATKMASLTPAERERVAANRGAESSGSAESVDDLARQFERVPPFRDAIRDAGLTTREYATLSLAMMQAGMALAVARMRPNDDQDSLAREMKANPANLRFMEEHEAEINRRSAELGRRMQQMERGGG